ncbi:prepilin-type N-terminal cleavage/methylation domain-containing protein [Thauera butanivorans]|jgi:general secretion pathway protein J|uniref:prepilin-type N-terminal cleavage/methylation domain-containing protein n=1 Tax=Thauera butanivorans TaxID=86174 RepID=UPI000837CB80|nr:prepilin-type N-terminal cleavage/methylation domain-containing protein [Thauera butanivorans]
MTRHASFPARRRSGFTLVEVVVALTLLSLLVLGLVSALRSFGQTSARLEAQTLANDDIRLVGGLLQRTLSRSSARLRMDSPETNANSWFQGDAYSVAWLGHLPARHGAGGLTHLKLEVSSSGMPEGGRLMLHIARFEGDKSAPGWQAGASRILLDRVDYMHIRYQGSDESGQPAWFDDWVEQPTVPTMIQIMLVVAGRPWPPIVAQVEDGFGSAAVARRGRHGPLSWR